MDQGLRRRPGLSNDDFDHIPLDAPSTFASTIKSLDVYPKVDADFEVQTSVGGMTSIVTMVIIFVLFMSELSTYLEVGSKHHITVDTNAEVRLPIHFNISFPMLPCSKIHMDMVDKMGEMHLDVHENIFKQRTIDGEPIGEPFSIDMEVADMEKEGCTTWGQVVVQKVAGNVHWALGASAQRNSRQHIHSFKMPEAYTFNSSHVIHSFSFGDIYPGMLMPLDNVHRIADGIAHYEYIIQVVPTEYERLDGSSLSTNQFTYTTVDHVYRIGERMQESNIPGVFFKYELSPFLVTVGDTSRPFSKFLTSCCAIIGGVFTVSGFIDAVVYEVQKWIKRTS